MEPNKIKLLDNYQLYQLLQSDRIDKHTMRSLKKEFGSRHLTTTEKERLEKKFQEQRLHLTGDNQEKPWDPLYTAFALNRHFRQLAFLKTNGRKKEARQYTLRLCFGIALYYVAVTIAILFLKAH